MSNHPSVPFRLKMVVLLLAGAVSACTQAPDAPPPWESRVAADHPLVGRIWRVSDGRFVGREELASALVRADLVLLGETHDNPDHHRIQAWATRRIVAAGKRPGIALEMIRADQQDIVDAHFRSRPGDAFGLGPALGWDHSGWPEWRHYAQIVAPVAGSSSSPVVLGANLPGPMIRAIARDGFKALGGNRVGALALDRPIPESVYGAVEREIVDSHCGHVQGSRARAFAAIQIARDAALADGILTAADRARGSAVLIAGTGHVRRDRGVPMHLTRRRATALTVVLAPLEVRDAATAPADYAAAFGASLLPFDFVWFTPRQDRGDPCNSFNKKS
jgi:uncharacterized iron-regulated protein